MHARGAPSPSFPINRYYSCRGISSKVGLGLDRGLNAGESQNENK